MLAFLPGILTLCLYTPRVNRLDKYAVPTAFAFINGLCLALIHRSSVREQLLSSCPLSVAVSIVPGAVWKSREGIKRFLINRVKPGKSLTPPESRDVA